MKPKSFYPKSFLKLLMHPDLGTVGKGQRKAHTARSKGNSSS